jgi:predicted nucleotidyltransferase
MLKNIFYSTCQQRVLYFLLAHPDKQYYDREISRITKTARASTNYALHGLMHAGLVLREKKGRMYFYYVNPKDPLIKQLKITQNIINIRPITEKLRRNVLKIVLYGSSADGSNHSESDIDLFVLARDAKKAKDAMRNNALAEKLKYVVATPQEFAKLKKTNQVFCKEVATGINLYEAKNEY